MLAEWLLKELDEVPDFPAFAGVDALHEQLRVLADAYPEIASLRRIGTSRDGEPLLCVTITGEAAGPAQAEALVFGLPHPNEPIGGLTALHLARRLCEDRGLRGRLGHTWHIVACIDPDGLRLNEGWLAGPFTREHYARHFYRPAGGEQVEWTFPLDYRDAYFDAALPETQALMRLIDERRPRLVCSLHNSELGGVYYYLSRAEPDLHPLLQALPEQLGLPLDRGEPESPAITQLADGIFEGATIRDSYDYLATAGSAWAGESGDNTASYAGRHGALTIISELPYWAAPSASDDRHTGVDYGAALTAHAAALGELAALLSATVERTSDDLLARESPFWRASRFFARFLTDETVNVGRRAAQPASRRPATVAELMSLREKTASFRLRYGGMLLRALDGELAVGNTTSSVRTARSELATRYDEWLADDAAEAESYETIPIRLLVAMQYAAAIGAAEHLTRRPAVTGNPVRDPAPQSPRG